MTVNSGRNRHLERRSSSRQQIMAQAKSLEEHFPSASFWASGLSKGSLRDLAGDVGPCSAVCSSLRSPLGASVTHPLREFAAQPSAISNVQVWYVFCVFSVVFRHQESTATIVPSVVKECCDDPPARGPREPCGPARSSRSPGTKPQVRSR